MHSPELSLFCSCLQLERDIYVVSFHRTVEETTFRSEAGLAPTSVCTFAVAIRYTGHMAAYGAMDAGTLTRSSNVIEGPVYGPLQGRSLRCRERAEPLPWCEDGPREQRRGPGSEENPDAYLVLRLLIRHWYADDVQRDNEDRGGSRHFDAIADHKSTNNPPRQ